MYRIRYAKRKDLAILILCICVVAIAPVFAFTPIAAPKNSPLTLCDGCNLTPPFALLGVELVLYIITFSLFSVKFARLENDNFNLKGVRPSS